MKFNNNKILDTKITQAILQDAYDAVPQLMTLLAPQGWQESPFHQELMACRYELYHEFLQMDGFLPTYTENRRSDSDKGPEAETTLSFDEYLYLTFPPIGNDHLELFYILSNILIEITFTSALYQDHEFDAYYFEEVLCEGIMIQLAHVNNQVDKEWANIAFTAIPPPYLDEMDVHHCLELLFTILKKHGFKLDYWHGELLYIVELQDMYWAILYGDLDYEEKDSRRQQIKSDISEILERYDSTYTDPLNLSSIVDLFNRRWVCPFVLAYLHVYDDFPKGYPYLLSDYEGY